MSEEKTVFVLLLGTRAAGDRYQSLQEEVALAAGRKLGLRVETDYAPAFDQLRVLKRRLAAGLAAAVFGDWYRVFAARGAAIDAVAAQSDELAMGVRRAARALPSSAQADAVRRARLLGVDACPGYGRELVDAGTLTASVEVPANAGLALELLQRFFARGTPLPLRSSTEPRPYPA